MKRRPPEPLDIPWICKPVESARSGVDILPDGRLHCWIEHEILHGVTPGMLVWWFKHLEGDIDYAGRRLNRYRVWHPRDHIAVEYSRRNEDGSVGVGCVIHLTEMFGGNPDYLTDVHTLITKLDQDGFAHRPSFHGLRLARVDYTFQMTAGGTLYRNSLTIGAAGFAGRLLNPLIRAFLFSEARGQAWIKHNIEEVGNFESFLPVLYAAHEGIESGEGSQSLRSNVHHGHGQPLGSLADDSTRQAAQRQRPAHQRQEGR
jgi:hypothetical protein